MKNNEELSLSEILELAKDENSKYSEIYEEYSEETLALATYLELPLDEINDIENDYENNYTYGKQEYFVADYSTTKAAEREYVESTIEECYLHEVPEVARNYIDMEKWIDDWSGNWSENLGSYDGNGEEIEINDTTYCICRRN